MPISIKAIIAISIFILLLSYAWKLDNELDRSKLLPLEEHTDVRILRSEELEQHLRHYHPHYEPFKPREYIRIRPTRYTQ